MLGILTYSQQSYTIAWNPVVMEGTITYQVFLKKDDIETYIGETNLCEYTIDMSQYEEGLHVIGVRAKREYLGFISFSDINWSNENGEETPNPFVLEYYQAVPVPINLRLL